MTGHLLSAMWDLAAVSLLGSAAALRLGRREWRLLALAGLGLLVAVCAVAGAWPGVALNGGLLALLLGDWFRRKGRKVAKVIGARSRAALAAVVGRMREAGVPVPEGVRA